jgi:hypothetical protein
MSNIPSIITSLVGALLSLLFGLFPALAKWFESKPQATKQLIMLGLIALATVIIFGLAFAGIGEGLGIPPMECNTEGILAAIMAFIQAVIANAGTYKATNYIVDTFQAKRQSWYS